MSSIRVQRAVTLSKKRIKRFSAVAEDRFTTIDLAGPRLFPGATQSMVESTLQRDVRANFLTSRPLDSRMLYQLINKATALLKEEGLQIPRSVTKPISPKSKAERFSLLWYCTPRDRAPFRVYVPSRHPDVFHDIAEYIAGGKTDPLRQKLFYVDGEIIGYFAPASDDPHFVAKTLLSKVRSLARWESFQTLFRTKRFRLTVAANSFQRKTEIEAEINSYSPDVPFEVLYDPRAALNKPKNNHSASKKENSK